MKSHIRNERIQYSHPLLRMKIWKEGQPHYNITGWNYHDELEVLLILQGHVNFHIDNRIYPLTSGDAVLIGSSQLHTLRVAGDNKFVEKVVLQFDLNHYFDPFIYPYIPYFRHLLDPARAINDSIGANRQLNDEIFRTVTRIYEESEQQRIGYEIAVSLLLKHILLTLLRHDPFDLTTSNVNETMILFQPVLEYVRQHLAEPISLKQMSELAGMSYYHFCRTFKKCLSMSFTEYVNYQRIKASERLLLTTNATVADIAEQVGFPNTSHFFKTFHKIHGDTPKGYKQKLNRSLQQYYSGKEPGDEPS